MWGVGSGGLSGYWGLSWRVHVDIESGGTLGKIGLKLASVCGKWVWRDFRNTDA